MTLSGKFLEKCDRVDSFPALEESKLVKASADFGTLFWTEHYPHAKPLAS